MLSSDIDQAGAGLHQIEPEAVAPSGNSYYSGSPVPNPPGKVFNMPVFLAHPFRTACAFVPYPIGVAIARWLAGNALVRRLFFSAISG